MIDQRQKDWLRANGDEARKRLSDKALTDGVLKGGQVIVYSLRIEQLALVERDENDLSEFATSSLPIVETDVPKQISGYKKYVGVAKLTDKQIDRILRLFSHSTYRIMRQLLIDKRNNPSEHLTNSAFARKINKILRTNPLGGKNYMLVVRDRTYQLWEME